MKLITKKWLASKKACTPSVRYAEENGWIGLPVTQTIDLLIWSSRLSDANWLITRVFCKKKHVEYAIFAAEQVLYDFEKKYPLDKRPRAAIDAAKKYLKNPCGKTMAHAYDSAYDASHACDAYHDDANSVAYSAAYSAYSAAYSAYSASPAAHAYAAADSADAHDEAIKIKIIKNGVSILERS